MKRTLIALTAASALFFAPLAFSDGTDMSGSNGTPNSEMNNPSFN
jgi:hypothetical protein